MKISAENVAIERAFAAVITVVAEPGDHAAERLNTVAQEGPPAVVLEADDGRPVPFDHYIADKAPRVCAGMDRMQVEYLGAGKLFTLGRAGSRSETIALHLHLNIRVQRKVVIPVRVLGCTALRADHDVPVDELIYGRPVEQP